MKKTIIALIAAAMVLPSCGGKKNTAGPEESGFTTVRKESYFKLAVPDDIASGRQYYSTSKVDITVPSDSASALSKTILAAAFPNDSVSEGFRSATERFLSEPVDFIQTSSEKISFIPDKPENSVLLSKNIVIDTIRTNGILTFHIVNQGYTGGAHGYYSAAYVNYDTTGNCVAETEKLFADREGVRQLILKQLAADNSCSVEELEENGVVFSVADVKVPENFYPEDGSLVFYYNPYEISSWARGEVRVAIPAKSLAMYASPTGKSFLQHIAR